MGEGWLSLLRALPGKHRGGMCPPRSVHGAMGDWCLLTLRGHQQLITNRGGKLDIPPALLSAPSHSWGGAAGGQSQGGTCPLRCCLCTGITWAAAAGFALCAKLHCYGTAAETILPWKVTEE